MDNIKKTILKYIKDLEVFELIKNKYDGKIIEKLKKSLIDSIRIIKSNKSKYSFEDELKNVVLNDKDNKDIKEIYLRNDDDILSKNFKDFNDHIIKIIPEEAYNLIHQEIVQSIQPRFFDDYDKEGYKIPCCFNYKPGYENITSKKKP